MGENILLQVLISSWHILLDSSVFMLFGFFISGLLRAFMPEDFVSSHLGKGRFSSVLKASALGVPLPLCSCGVLPAAAGLREQGANKGATASFLISTPETGVDSIAVTWALLDPIMTIFRPLAAFVTAMITGLFINRLGNGSASEEKIKTPVCTSSCCSLKEKHDHGFVHRLKNGMSFALNDLFDDIAGWFFFGVLIAGAVDVFVSPNLINTYLGEGLFSMIVVLAVSAPLYICATASTPVAAALALKGLSPGAALVFLLAGPATNVASLTVITRILGKKSTVIYLVSIIVSSLSLGLVANFLYAFMGMDVSGWVSAGVVEKSNTASIVSSFVLLLLYSRVLFRKYLSVRKNPA